MNGYNHIRRRQFDRMSGLARNVTSNIETGPVIRSGWYEVYDSYFGKMEYALRQRLIDRAKDQFET